MCFSMPLNIALATIIAVTAPKTATTTKGPALSLEKMLNGDGDCGWLAQARIGRCAWTRGLGAQRVFASTRSFGTSFDKAFH